MKLKRPKIGDTFFAVSHTAHRSTVVVYHVGQTHFYTRVAGSNAPAGRFALGTHANNKGVVIYKDEKTYYDTERVAGLIERIRRTLSDGVYTPHEAQKMAKILGITP